MIHGILRLRLHTCTALALAALGMPVPMNATDLSQSFRTQKAESSTLPANPNHSAPRSPLAKVPTNGAVDATAGRELLLSDLDSLLASGSGPLSVHLCFAGLSALGEIEVAQGAIVSQALAVRASSVPLEVTYGPRLAAVRCNVLIGTVDQVVDFLPASDVQKVQRCIIALRRLPGRADSLLLVVAGKTQDAITHAVLSLAFVRSPLPNAPSALIKEVTLGERPEFLRQPPLDSGTTLTLGNLMDRGAPARLLSDGGVAMTLFFPGFRATVGAPARMGIHFDARDAAFGASGNLLVRMNGREVARIRRSETNSSPLGGREAVVSLPLDAFKHGANRLEISADPAQPSLQVFADSTLQIPKLNQPAVLPDLRNTAGSFFPFVGQPDGSDLAIQLPDPSPETIQSAWTLLARLAQGAQTVFHAADISFGTSATSRHRVVIAPYASLPADMQVRMPFSIFDSVVSLEALEARREQKQGRNLKETISAFVHAQHAQEAQQPAPDEPTRSAVGSAVDAKTCGYLACLAPTKEQPQWSLVLTAFTPELLLARTHKVIQDGWWDRVEGDIVRWAEEPPLFQSNVPVLKHLVATEQPFVEMPFGERFNVRGWMSAAAIVILIFALFTSRMLERRAGEHDIRESA